MAILGTIRMACGEGDMAQEGVTMYLSRDHAMCHALSLQSD